MRAVIALVLFAGTAAYAEVKVEVAGFGGQASAWHTWAPRPEIAPRTFRDAVRYRTRTAALAVSGNSNPGAFGGWECTVSGVEPGKWYRFTAYYRAEGLSYEPLQVLARLDWARAGRGTRAGQPDYVWQSRREGDWTRVTAEAPAPAQADAVNVQLFLQNAPAATVWWDDIRLEQIPTPAPRNVRVVSINLRPGKTASAAESVGQFVKTIDRTVPDTADLIVLPEGISVVGTPLKYADVAESIPGPVTEMLGQAARRKKSYIAAGVYEREGALVYNTAVLIDREGRVAGKYRKVYIPREEMEGGVTPGSDYPVFRTDFGTVGMMICWDLQYPDPARTLAMRGAEIIVLPIWGGNRNLGKARAIENHVFLVSSGYDYPTSVMDPNGEILSEAKEQGQAAVVTLDLNRRYPDPWLGDMRARFMKELRLDVRP